MVFGRASFISLRGKITIDAPEIRPGMIRLGYPEDLLFSPKNAGVININGEIVFKGRFDAGSGYYFRVYHSGKVVFGRNTKIGSDTKITSMSEITLGDHTRMAFEVVIMDTSVHYTIDMITHTVAAAHGAVRIGAYNWIANRCTIQKGTHTPDNVIVASGSLLNKDYTVKIPQYSLMGGSPAKLLKENVSRVWSLSSERMLGEVLDTAGVEKMEFTDLKLK
jgi:acetyltransferase-like isoleucine patch superfamily enzyme